MTFVSIQMVRTSVNVRRVSICSQIRKLAQVILSLNTIRRIRLLTIVGVSLWKLISDKLLSVFSTFQRNSVSLLQKLDSHHNRF